MTKNKKCTTYKQRAAKRRNQNNPKGSLSTDDGRPSYREIIRENKEFDAYYMKQNICKADEWDNMLKLLKTDLPASFRITCYPREEANQLLSIVKSKYFKNLVNSEDNTDKEPFCLPWYPEELGWQIQITRNDIRKSESYFQLHNFLISETSVGNISRQEVVSMIPPLLMDIQPHHKILDMCAAPGSKTAQIIEILHSKSESDIPDGLVIANDINNNRCYKLVHQVKRLNSPCAIVTNHDAAIMPNFFFTNEDGSKSVLKFDRILCDVPCTGDGTMRKNPDIWTKWNSANGNNLHGIQIRVLKRGLEMLAVGGLLVYSTCSLNPVENEAVLHRLLSESDDSVEIMDVSSVLPGLKYSPGVTHWFPASRDMSFYNNFEEVPEKWRTVVRPNMFPPSEADAHKYHLDRCIRILPHYQNTGAFFVAVLKKLKLLPWESQKSATLSEKSVSKPDEDIAIENSINTERPKKKIKLGYKEDPFVFFTNEEIIWPLIREFYGIVENSFLPSCLFTRCIIGKKKNIYLASKLTKNVISNNAARIKLINSGVKVLSRCDSRTMGCSFRLTHEGIASIHSSIDSKRKLTVSKPEMIEILLRFDPKNPLSITDLDEETKKHASDIENGSCVLLLNDDSIPLKLVGWKGVQTIRAYITQADSVHYLRILGEDVSRFNVNKFKKDVVTAELAPDGDSL